MRKALRALRWYRKPPTVAPSFRARHAGALGAGIILLAALSVVMITRMQSDPAEAVTGVRLKGKSIPRQHEVLRSVDPKAVTSTISVSVTPASLTRMMEADVASRQDYITWLRTDVGEAAAAQVERSIRGPYQRKIDEIAASASQELLLEVRVVTLWGSVSFSAMSYDASLRPMDPVSLFFFDRGSTANVYAEMAAGDICPACDPTAFQDQNGMVRTVVKGRYQCGSQNQWVLMGNADGELDWRMGGRGLMRSSDRCMEGTRDHMRVFGSVDSAQFGTWSVGTPHREKWVSEGGSFRHRIESWNDAQADFAGFWRDRASEDDQAADSSFIEPFDWGTGGVYQNVMFNGQGIAIRVCGCR